MSETRGKWNEFMTTEIKSAALELGTERIRKLLVQYAVPAVVAMTASSLYNMVDSIFIGHGVGPLAISGLALTFPLMNLAAAFGSLVGVGAATLVSMRLGQRDYDTAQPGAGQRAGAQSDYRNRRSACVDAGVSSTRYSTSSARAMPRSATHANTCR